MIRAVCFDLDGTLLPLDIDEFCKYYFGMLAKKMTAHGYDPMQLIGAIKVGTVALSPRGDWRMPTDADVRLWVEQL